MSITARFSGLARAVLLAAALASPLLLAGCARTIDDGTYYLGQNDRVPTAVCAAWAAC